MRGRGAEDADRAGHVPADVVVRGVDDVAHSRRGFEAEDERLDEVAAAHAIGAGVGKERRAHRRARMAVVLRRRVVVVLDVRADAVHQRRMQRIEPLDPADDARGPLARERTQRANRGRDSGMRAATNRATDDVDDGSLGFVADVSRDVLPPVRDDVGGKGLGFVHDYLCRSSARAALRMFFKP